MCKRAADIQMNEILFNAYWTNYIKNEFSDINFEKEDLESILNDLHNDIELNNIIKALIKTIVYNNLLKE